MENKSRTMNGLVGGALQGEPRDSGKKGNSEPRTRVSARSLPGNRIMLLEILPRYKMPSFLDFSCPFHVLSRHTTERRKSERDKKIESEPSSLSSSMTM